ncbi:Glucuronosyltransferase [Aphelenchoides bicaudatus]|nr:Glucuronosyltransferase [Aphelenchoides bicaudatus]
MRVTGSVLILCLLVVSAVNGLKILMYQIAFSPSHMPFSGAIADTLIERGHTVDKIISVINPHVKSNGSTRLRNVYRITRKDEENPFLKLMHFSDPFKVTPDPRHNPHYIETRKVFCEELLKDTEFINKLKAEQYDVMLVAPYEYCVMALHHILQIPSVSAYTATQNDEYLPKYLGFPLLPSFVTSAFDQEVYEGRLTFMQRLRNIFVLADQYFYDEGIGVKEFAYLKQKIPDLPQTPRHLYSRLVYVFRNTNEILSAQRPESSKIKYIGGLAKERVKSEMTQEVSAILDRPSKGTIVFSFGSLFSTKAVKRETKKEILNAFNYFREYTFIWKFDSTDPDRDLLANHTNVHAVSWLPQVPLLNDERVKLFISHFGMNSYLEVAQAGKPVIGIPIFADQQYNLGCAVRKGFALYVDKTNITTEALRHAINEILTHPSYTQRAKEISSMLESRPISASQELIQSVEYSAKHPQLFDVLQLESNDMGLIEYYCLDVFFILIAVSIALLSVLFFVFKRFVRFVSATNKIKTKKA